MTAYRSIDGTDNNQNFNATATDMTRVGTAHFADGVSQPIETVNPRTVSNNVVGQGDPDVPNPDGLSAFIIPGASSSTTTSTSSPQTASTTSTFPCRRERRLLPKG